MAANSVATRAPLRALLDHFWVCAGSNVSELAGCFIGRGHSNARSSWTAQLCSQSQQIAPAAALASFALAAQRGTGRVGFDIERRTQCTGS